MEFDVPASSSDLTVLRLRLIYVSGSMFLYGITLDLRFLSIKSFLMMLVIFSVGISSDSIVSLMIITFLNLTYLRLALLPFSVA